MFAVNPVRQCVRQQARLRGWKSDYCIDGETRDVARSDETSVC